MKKLLFLLFSGVANAAPTCYPGDPSAAEPMPNIIVQATGACVQWHCDVSHKWVTNSICGTWAEATSSAIDTLRAALTKTTAEKDAMWNAAFTQPIDPSSPDAALAAVALAQPLPNKAPPSGRVTQSTVAYKQSPAINGYSAKILGTVPLGVACGPLSFTDAAGKVYYALVDRNAVTPTKVGNYVPPLPTVAFGVCQ